MVDVTTSEGQHPQETPAPAEGGMVRACDRCGTVCSADQEWCLACGVRMSAVSTRLPGLRAAGVVVSLAVLLAGGAAAASYAALRSDTSTTAAAPAGPAGTPVTPAPTPPPVTPAEDPTVPAPPVDEELPPLDDPDLGPEPEDLAEDFEDEASDLDLGPDLSSGAPAAPPAPAPPIEAPADTGGDATDATDSTDDTSGPDSGGADSGTESGSGSRGGDTGGDTGTEADASGPIELAIGQGSLYDPMGVVADRGDESRAIDGNVKTSWRTTLVDGKSGEFGYVLDFASPTALKTLTLHSPTEGLKVKVLGTTRKTLPASTTDAQWVELAPLQTLKGGAGASTDFKLDGAKKLRHVLLLIAEAPGTPGASQINEIQISR
jgi:hypothetical protein